MLGIDDLRYNSKHPYHAATKYVENLQKRLYALGLLNLDNITGVMNRETDNAIRKFQEGKYLKVDGWVGEKTKERLYDSESEW